MVEQLQLFKTFKTRTETR